MKRGSLACALRDNGAGRLVATELNPIKAAKARENLRSTGLADLVDLREGDALQTLTQGLEGGVDMVLLDGWKEIYLQVLHLLEPHLSPGALVIADDGVPGVRDALPRVRPEGGQRLSLRRRTTRRRENSVKARCPSRYQPVEGSSRTASGPSGEPARGALHLAR
ncbi:O-methyltransferase [Sorangium sp. So ce1128]